MTSLVVVVVGRAVFLLLPSFEVSYFARVGIIGMEMAGSRWSSLNVAGLRFARVRVMFFFVSKDSQEIRTLSSGK